MKSCSIYTNKNVIFLSFDHSVVVVGAKHGASQMFTDTFGTVAILTKLLDGPEEIRLHEWHYIHLQMIVFCLDWVNIFSVSIHRKHLSIG